ncbi:MAG: hypothetical protein WEC34_02095 [Acidimicrobiia bacterium]
MLVLGAIAGIVVLVALLLVFGVRSPWLDERRNRLIVIGIGAAVLLGAFFGIQAWSSNEVEREADDVAARMRAALQGSGPELLPSEAELLRVGLSGIDIAAVEVRRDRTTLYSPVSSLGQERCVRGVVDISTHAVVAVLDETCPSS